MIIRSLRLDTFRNYRRLDLSVGPSINILYGDNAQGKTNIVEAIYLLSCARSHRTAKDLELIYHREPAYKVAADILRDRDLDVPPDELKQRTQTLQIVYDTREKIKRTGYHNGMPLPKIGDFVGMFHAVIFAPEDLQLIKEGPSVRRRFIDVMISQIRPTYFNDLLSYYRLLQQRNRLIKNIRRRGGVITEKDHQLLEIWEHPMAALAANLISLRQTYIDQIQVIASARHKEISGQAETLQVCYRPIPALDDRALLQEQLLTKWAMSRKDDIERGNTGVGPHRDDMVLYINQENLRAFASQGQQRSAALSLKLAEFEILHEATGESPVLLLDDVLSELDADRRRCLLANIHTSQVFITCTDRQMMARRLETEWYADQASEPDVRYYHVKQGEITPG